MRLRAAFCCGLLALAPVSAGEAPSVRPLTALRIEGGGDDDRRFAVTATGLKVGQPVDEAAFQLALAAVRLVDRYQSVEGTLGADGSASLRLVPILPLATWRWEGDPIPKPLRKTLLPELRKGSRLGPQRRSKLITLAEQRLGEAGYPVARLQMELKEGGRSARLLLKLGPPSMVREVRVEGDPAPYTREVLLKQAKLQPGKTFWTPATIRNAQRRLREFMIKDDRLEGSVRLEPGSESGALLLEVRPGPKVTLRSKGLNLLAPLWGQPRLSEFVPLARAERYTPSLLEEGAGRITTYFRNQGYPEAKVTYERRVTAGIAEHPEAVLLTFTLVLGEQRNMAKVQLEGNRELSDKDLQPAVTLPRRWLVMAPHARAEIITSLEERVTAFYLQRGFPDVVVRRRVDTTAEGSVEVRLLIKEGPRRFLEALVLDLPADPGFSRETLSKSLLLALSDKPASIEGKKRFRSDRKALRGIEGTMVITPQGARLQFQPSLPLVRNDIALVVADLRLRLSSAGSANPQMKLAFEDDKDHPILRIQVPAQRLDHARRLVVQGSDRTRAEALLREIEFSPGVALDPAQLEQGQFHIGGLGAFQRVDLLTLKDLPDQDKQPWQRGDLALVLEERSPWVFSESFGYDNTQGYHFGFNTQRLNVGGMGRTVDMNIRAGDQTLNLPKLAELFPTGKNKRAVDSYSIGYTDPWFLPGSLDAWLSNRTRFRAEAAYIEEAQAAYFARRRRFVPSLQWNISPIQVVQLGYRFERVDVAANTDSNGKPLILDADLFLIAKTPSHSIISAPYLQVTVDRRDRPVDPTDGTFFLGKVELALQTFGTSPNSSFAKLDLRYQMNFPMGFRAEHGVVMASARMGLARPTSPSAEDLPLSERFYGGGSSTLRGVEPDMLGPIARTDSKGNPLEHLLPLGGQGLAVVNLEYRFPFFGMQTIWAEVFVDSGQVYASLHPAKGALPPFPPFRTTVGAGLIFKLGFPLKLEYAVDWKRIRGLPRSQDERDTELKSLLISAGYQF